MKKSLIISLLVFSFSFADATIKVADLVIFEDAILNGE